MLRSACASLLLIAVGGVVAGCGLGDGTGRLDGTLYVRGCSQSNDYGSLAAPTGYSLAPTWFSADPIDSPPYEERLHPVNRIEIRVQTRGTRQEQADVLYVNVADEAPVAAALNQPLPLGPATNVRATLTLNETCQYAEEGNMELDGSITFTAFGSATGAAPPVDFSVEYGDRVAANLAVTVVDRRAITLGGVGSVPPTPVVAGQLTGSFDFIVQPGKAATPF